jgi:hypothetical protein
MRRQVADAGGDVLRNRVTLDPPPDRQGSVDAGDGAQ